MSHGFVMLTPIMPISILWLVMIWIVFFRGK